MFDSVLCFAQYRVSSLCFTFLAEDVDDPAEIMNANEPAGAASPDAPAAPAPASPSPSVLNINLFGKPPVLCANVSNVVGS